jgi:hypothetical protein
MKLLTKLYRTFSPTWREDAMSKLVRERLDDMGIEYDCTGLQIHNIKPYKPLVCAHLDQVGTQPVRKLEICNGMIWGDVQIGADDKNGIWICLRLLEQFPDIGFIFSTGEEAGCDIDDVLEEYDEDILDSVLYGLVFDRRGSRDIIGCMNDYCKADFQDDVTRIGRPMEFFTNTGIWSDADMLAYYDIPCVNISAGYYQPHTDAEFTDLDDLLKSLEFGKQILTQLDKLYKRTDYYEVNRRTAMMMAPEDKYRLSKDPLTGDRDLDGDRYQFFCTTCDAELTEHEVSADYLCKECWSEVQSLDDYEFYSGSGHDSYEEIGESGVRTYYDNKYERSVDATSEYNYKKTDEGWTQLFYCPVCYDFMLPENDGCPECKSRLIKSAMYSG